jgi:hypothetical protein
MFESGGLFIATAACLLQQHHPDCLVRDTGQRQVPAEQQ